MDNNPNPYNFPDSQNQSSNVPPPPPSMDSQVGVRSMQSDLESVKQSGGEAPQSQIINAPELPDMGQQQPVAQNPQTNFQSQNYATPETPAQQTPPVSSEPMPSFSQASYQPSDGQPALNSKPGLNLKTILFIVLGLVVAGGIGYGAYYLVSGMSSSPQISIPTASNNTTSTLPLLPPPVTQTSTPTSTPVSNVPVIPPLVHQSLILNPTKAQTLVINPVDLPDFQSVVASSSKEKMLVASVKDLAFVDASSTPIESTQFLKSYFPVESQMLSQVFDRDFTSWLYYDKTGGAKFGVVLKLKSSVSLDQASSSLGSILENGYSDVKNLFVSTTTVPSKIEFKGGIISGVSVRYLVYDLKTAKVFEYAWMTAGGNNYLVMATSYNQMADIIKRLKALPAQNQSTGITTTTSTITSTTTPIVPPPVPPVTSPTTTTTGTTTINP